MKRIKQRENTEIKIKTKILFAALIFALGAAIASPAGAQDKPTADPRMAGSNGKIGRTLTVADSIYMGGPIITVNDAQPTAEAVAVKDGKILAVGKKAEVLKIKRVTRRRSSTSAARPCFPGS